jgi:polar amino acid transport system substrate-binding protein
MSRIGVLSCIAAAALALGLTQGAWALQLVTEENPPLNYGENGQVTGSATEIVREMGKRAGVPMTISLQQWDRAYQAAQTQRETCVYSTVRLPDREGAFKWVGPVGITRWGLFALQGFAQPIESLKDAGKYRIGAVTYDAKGRYLKEKGLTNVVETENDAQNPAKLTLNPKEPGKTDLWIANLHQARRLAEKAQVRDIKLVYVVADFESYLACNPSVPAETLDKLSKALEGIKKDGSYQRIVETYEAKFPIPK